MQKITTFNTNIGCDNYVDCGNCTYYGKCAINKKYMVDDVEVTTENLDEIRKTYKLSRAQVRTIRNGTK